MSETDKGRKIAPPRNDFKPTPLVKERPSLKGLDPRFRYERFSLDPRHPAYVGNKLRRHDIGDDVVGYCEVPPWELVHRETDPAVEQLHARDDQGRPLGTEIRHGNTVLCRIPKETWEGTYGQVDRARIKAEEERLSSLQPQEGGAVRRVVPNADADVFDVLGGR